MGSLQVARCGVRPVVQPALKQLLKDTQLCTALSCCSFSTTPSFQERKHYRLVVVGGGAGGLAMAHSFCRKLGKGKVAIIEPSDKHYAQATFTLVGAGICKYEASYKPQGKVMPRHCQWIKDSVETFDPDSNLVTTKDGTEIEYDYMVIAMGLQLNYHLIKGLPKAFEMDPTVCSNYSPQYVKNTYPALRGFKEGNAIFTSPRTPIKCPGAAMKVIFLAEEILRKAKKRDGARIMYNTPFDVLFPVLPFVAAIEKITEDRDIKVNFKQNLIEVNPHKREAVFENLLTGEHIVHPYSFLHVTPPMSTPDPLRFSSLVSSTGYVTVNKETLQHTRYPNIFAIGDNTNAPATKTAAAVASQGGTVVKNLTAVMNGQPGNVSKYNGYSSCPLLTGGKKAILAEFDWNGHQLPTFPFDQTKERRLIYHMKKDVLHHMYWHMLIRGRWRGPGVIRDAFNYMGFTYAPVTR